MKVIELQKNMYLYSVPAHHENGLAQNICVLVNESEALLIDAGYQNECRQVIDDLLSKGINIVKVIPSHFHPDHVEGIYLMDNPDVYGNIHAADTLKQFYQTDSIKPLLPTAVTDDKTKITFGTFELSFLHAPGHSDCSMLIFINESYIHLGDLFIRDIKGNEVLPYVKWNNVKNHIKSLSMILKYKEMKVLISHGLCPFNQNDLETGIADRIKYLQALIDSDNRTTAEDAVKKCIRPFTRLQWRNDVK